MRRYVRQAYKVISSRSKHRQQTVTRVATNLVKLLHVLASKRRKHKLFW
jgi:hypothetical protein